MVMVITSVIVVAGMHLAFSGQARIAMAAAVGVSLCVIAVVRPTVAILLTMVYLPFQGEFRRALLYLEPWSGFDPLLLVGPAVVGVLTAQLLLRGSSVPTTPLNKWVRVLLVVMLIQVINPLQGGIRVGVTGMLFYVVPLLWYWAGREHVQPRTMYRLLLGIVLPIGTITALVGCYQVFVGMPEHHLWWIHEGGYAALQQGGGTIKAFSTFASSQEFAAYTGIAALTVFAMLIYHRRASILLFAIVPIAGMLMTGSRGPIVMILGGITVILAVQARSMKAWAPGLVLASVLSGAGLYFTLVNIDANSVNDRFRPMLQHQIDGLTDPVNSTAPGHVKMKIHGVIAGLKNPLGYGLGSTTLAAGKFGGGLGRGTEADISNIFVSLGVVGGVAYLGVIVLALKQSLMMWHHNRQEIGLLALALLVITLGQWLSGAVYSVVPLVWLMIGVIDRQAALSATNTTDQPKISLP